MDKIKIKLVAIAKNEAAYLPQWIFHHLRLGVDSIDIYINGSSDNSVEISRIINSFEPRFKFYESDKYVEKCIKEGKKFQKYIYNRALRKCKNKDSFSHLLFLDLDEYLMPDKLEHDLKNFIRSRGGVSVVSFPWCFDAPSSLEAEPFQKFICPTINLSPHSHVKSIGRIDDIKRVLPHTFILKNTELSDLKRTKKILSTGIEINSKNSRVHGSILGREAQIVFEVKISESWFILHRVNKSEAEYLASLLKGRPSRLGKKDFSNLLKDNREGFKLFDPKTMLQKSYDTSSIHEYCIAFNKFLDRLNLRLELEKSQYFVLNQLRELDDLICRYPNVVDVFNKQFAGTRYFSYRAV